MNEPLRALIIAAGLSSSLLHMAQAPQRFSYQAVVRDDNGALLPSTSVGMRISVLQGSENGTAVYVETHVPQTNQNGLVSLEVGGGAVVSGDFTAIDWGSGPFFLRTETDPDGGTSYSISGARELLSVPYALHAANNLEGPPGPPGPPGMPGAEACAPNDRDSLIVLYNASFAYGYHQLPGGDPIWSVQALGNTNHSAISSKRAVVLYNAGTAYAFHLDNAGVGQWSSQPLGNTNHIAVASDRSVVLYNNATAYAFHVDGSGTGTWTTQALGNTNHSNKAHGNKVVLWNFNTAYAFSVDPTGNGTWTTQTIGGTVHQVATTR